LLSFGRDTVEVSTPDGRRKITQRGGSSTTSLASLLLGELARERPDMQR
jgi:hypothetical protein